MFLTFGDMPHLQVFAVSLKICDLSFVEYLLLHCHAFERLVAFMGNHIVVFVAFFWLWRPRSALIVFWMVFWNIVTGGVQVLLGDFAHDGVIVNESWWLFGLVLALDVHFRLDWFEGTHALVVMIYHIIWDWNWLSVFRHFHGVDQVSICDMLVELYSLLENHALLLFEEI